MRRTIILVMAMLVVAACGQAAQATTPPGVQIPSLTLPEGATPHGGGGGGGGGGRQHGEEAGFDFSSELAPDEIHNHFAGQLEANGWELRSEESSDQGPLSYWEVFDEQGRTWAAKLTVEQLGGEGPFEYRVTVNMITP